MQNDDNGEKTDIVKLFIILIAISSIGFGVGAAYLYHHQSAYAELVETEKKAMTYMKKLAESPENKVYWGFERKGAGRMTGDDLASYLLRKATTQGVAIDTQNSDRDEHREYVQMRVTQKLSDADLEKIVRYLYNVQQGKNDIAITSIKLANFDYEQPVPTCKATLIFTVYDEAKPEK